MVATSVILSQFKEDVLSASVVSEFIMRRGGGGETFLSYAETLIQGEK